MKKTILATILLAMSVSSFAFNTTSLGDSHIETRESDGRKVLFISGDTAKDMYKDLLSREDYIENVLGSNRPTEGAKELRHAGEYFTEWMCLDLTNMKNQELMKHFRSNVLCRMIINKGSED